MKDRGLTSKFRNAKNTFLKFTRGSSVFHNTMKNKKVEFNSYMYSLSKLSCFGYEISVFNTQRGSIHNSSRLMGTVSSKNECQQFSYVHSYAEKNRRVNI